MKEAGSQHTHMENKTVLETNVAARKEGLFAPWVWKPLLSLLVTLVVALFVSISELASILMDPLWVLCAVILLYFLIQFVGRLFMKQWRGALYAFLRLVGLLAVSIVAMVIIGLASGFLGPSEDHFADNLTIPSDIEIALPEDDALEVSDHLSAVGTDEMQIAIRSALREAGGEDSRFIPSMPSLRRAATEHQKAFHDYLEASPDWHVFIERGNRFAARRWSYAGEPRDELHGYISEFNGDAGFQTRCLLCLDRKAWSRYSVRHVQEGGSPVNPELSIGNQLKESRVMIECGGVWLEIFEQSGKPERRVTKATIKVIEKEFARFLNDPNGTVEQARERSRSLALRLAGKDAQPFRLLTGMQPGIYGIAYALNPGEPGVVYLKAFELTKNTRLSEDRLRAASETRMSWSDDPAERFGAKAGFTIYEGDWGKPYAARFEVWFKPDSNKPERKLAERIYKIEGWQR